MQGDTNRSFIGTEQPENPLIDKAVTESPQARHNAAISICLYRSNINGAK